MTTELVAQMAAIVNELKRFPAQKELQEIPYWTSLLDRITHTYGSLEAFQERAYQDRLQEVRFPSPAQEETTAQILEIPHILIRDAAGTGKTAPAVQAKYALEQLRYQSPVLSLVICPGYVMSSWAQKISEYTNGRAQVASITSANRHEAIEDIGKRLRAGTIPDFTLLSYDSLFRDVEPSDSILDWEHGQANAELNGNEDAPLSRWLSAYVQETGYPFYLVLDEPQHIRTPGRRRTRAVEDLAAHADHLVALSGTIFPDYLDDIYVLMSLFDRERYPTAADAEHAYQNDPRLIRLFLLRHCKQPVLTTDGLVQVTHTTETLDLSPKERAIYNTVLSSSEFGSEKLPLLRIAALDARLLDPDRYPGSLSVQQKLETVFSDRGLFAQAGDPVRYLALDRWIEQVISRGEKAVVFSVLREGVTEELERRYRRYGSCRIDGSVSAEPNGGIFSPRDRVRLDFQTNPDTHILIASITSLREGQDLHAANNTAFLGLDFSPGYNDQAGARVARLGQRWPVNSHYFHVRNTVETGVRETVRAKQEAIHLVDLGFELTAEQRELLSRRQTQPHAVAPYLQNPETLLRMMVGHMRDRGADQNMIYLQTGENAQLYAESFNFNLDISYAGQTARLLDGLLYQLGEEGALPDHPRILDLASPGTLTRLTGRPSTCVDFNRYQIEFGLRDAQRRGVQLEGMVGNVEDLSDLFSDSVADITVLSLALHYGNAETGGRKRMLLEANRVTRQGGKLLLTLPYSSATGERFDVLEEGLEYLGWHPVDKRHGIAFAVDSSRDFHVYAALCEKMFAPPRSLYTNDRYNDLLSLARPLVESLPGRGAAPSLPILLNRERCTVFQFEHGDLVHCTPPPLPAPPSPSPPPATNQVTPSAAETNPELVRQYLDHLSSLSRKKRRRHDTPS